MERKSTRRGRKYAALYALASLAFVAALFATPTRRIAREHVSYLLPVEPNALGPMRHFLGEDNGYGLSPRERAFAAAHPDDDAMQVSLAMRGTPRTPSTDWCFEYFRNVAPLMDRFPRSAVVRAAALRYGTTMSFKHSAATPGHWAAYDRAASEGQSLEPDNAFFPLMAAWGLRERGREVEATQSLLRAGRESRWDDHSLSEIQGTWRLRERGDPTPDGLNRLVTAATALYPHYAGMRGFVRGETTIANNLEASGRAGQGIAIRHALMQAGGLMRSQSTVLIGNLVGIAIVNEAARVPGSEGIGHSGPRADIHDTAREQAYERYVVARGHPEEAEYARSQFQIGADARAGLKLDSSEGDVYAVLKPLRVWPLALGLLVCAAVMLLCGIVTAVLARMGWADPKRRMSWTERIVVIIIVAAVVLLPVLWESTRLVEPARWLQLMFNAKTGIGPVLPVTVLVLLAVPIVLKVVLIVAALVRRKPLTASVVSGFHRAALPIAAIMVLCYCGVLVNLARRDREIADTITMKVQHEGRYYAHLEGRPWPE